MNLGRPTTNDCGVPGMINAWLENHVSKHVSWVFI